VCGLASPFAGDPVEPITAGTPVDLMSSIGNNDLARSSHCTINILTGHNKVTIAGFFLHTSLPVDADLQRESHQFSNAAPSGAHIHRHIGHRVGSAVQ
jgi:hypothetical protein